MKRHASRAQQQSARSLEAQPRRDTHRAVDDQQPNPHEWRAFDANIQGLAEETETLSELIQEWLVRGIQAVVQAVKLQIAGGPVPPDRRLPPPNRPEDDDRDSRASHVVSRRPRSPR